MGGNQINLFKYRYGDNNLSTDTRNGGLHWGSYVAGLQGAYGDTLTWKLTRYNYRNYYLFEVQDGK